MATPIAETWPIGFSPLSDEEVREHMNNLAKAFEAYDRAEEAQRKVLLEQQLQPDQPKKTPVLLANHKFGKRVPDDLIRNRSDVSRVG
jgi:hypothetical protein